MAYQPKPGSGTLFKNDRKEKDSHPDYRGDLCLPDGEIIRLAGWIKDGAKGKFLSLSVDRPREDRDDAQSFRGGGAGGMAGRDSGRARIEPLTEDFDDQIPF